MKKPKLLHYPCAPSLFHKGLPGLSFFLALLILGATACRKQDAAVEPKQYLNITAISPDSNSTGIALDTTISVVFGSTLDAARMAKGSFLLNDGATPVQGTVQTEGNRATFLPATDLQPSTTYTVTITTGAADQKGNALAKGLSWRFTTKGADTYRMTKRSDAVTDFIRDGSRTMQIGNYLYSFGGWTAQPEDSYNDVYRSSGNLSTWEKRPNAPWHGRHVFGVGQLNGLSYVIGGDNIHNEFDVWSTADGENWTRKATDVLDSRVYAGITAHNGYLYVVGGLWHKDVWRSKDGASWTQVTTNVSFLNGENYAGSLASFGGKLWMVCGGGDGGGGGTFRKWVWSSPDGATWTREPDFGGSERSYTDVCVWDNKLWVVGGYNIHESNTTSIWYMSRSGKWTELETPSDYLGRHATAVSVYNNQLAITCGNYNNDCWVIEKLQ